MKKDNKKEKDFNISSIFTEKELAQLNFTEEELADIMAAEAMGEFVDIMPNGDKEMDEFFTKFEALFRTGEPAPVVYQRYMDLAKTDPKFQAQIVAMTFLLDQIEEVPESKTEKVSLEDIKKEQESQLSDERKQKIAEFDRILKSMK